MCAHKNSTAAVEKRIEFDIIFDWTLLLNAPAMMLMKMSNWISHFEIIVRCNCKICLSNLIAVPFAPSDIFAWMNHIWYDIHISSTQLPQNWFRMHFDLKCTSFTGAWLLSMSLPEPEPVPLPFQLHSSSFAVFHFSPITSFHYSFPVNDISQACSFQFCILAPSASR